MSLATELGRYAPTESLLQSNMRGRLSQVLFVTSLLIGCDTQAVPDSAGTHREVVVPPNPAASVTAAQVEDPTCDLDHTVAHADPDSLITEFLSRDAAGRFLQTDQWFNGATECPGHEPGPDSYTVIRSYSVKPLKRTGDTVTVAVTSIRLGTVSGQFARDSGTIVDTVGAIRTPYGWRIIAPALRQFVSQAVAAKRGDLANAAPRSEP